MPRPNISSSDYVYRPWSEERRRRASEAAIARSGAKPGHRMLYDIQVPNQIYVLIVDAIHFYRQSHTKKETRAAIKWLVDAGGDFLMMLQILQPGRRRSPNK